MSNRAKIYHLRPSEHIPNSPYPLLHYPGVFSPNPAIIAGQVYDTFDKNGWQAQWIYRYGQTQQAHYHSTAHETMAVTSGQATIRFGVADISTNAEENTYGSSYEQGGVTLHVTTGDVLVIPAGVSHKTYDAVPRADFKLLTPGDGSSIEAEDPRTAVASIELADGMTMLGAYPPGSTWDFQTAGTADDWGKIWSLPRPEKDPVLGDSIDGLCGLWQANLSPHKSAYEQQ